MKELLKELKKKLEEDKRELSKQQESLLSVVGSLASIDSIDISALEDSVKVLSLSDHLQWIRSAYYDTLSDDARQDIWVEDVYETYLIVNVSDEGKILKVPYVEGDDSITFGEAIEVEVQYIPKSKSIGLQIKSVNDKQMTVEGYGIVWGGMDLEGDHFTKDTDFWFDQITSSPMVLFDHGQDGTIKKSVIGKVSNKTEDNFGLWVESQIERSNEYFEAVQELVETGRLGYSSGAVSHLVERNNDGKIVQWPIVEFSLTATPAEPRTLGVEALKSLAETEPAYKALLPDEKAEPSADGTERERKLKEAEIKQHLISIEMKE